VHPGGDLVTPALKHHAACGRKVDADVRAVQLLLDDERGIADEVQRLPWAQMLVVARAALAEQMRRSRVFREIVARCAHDSHPSCSLTEPFPITEA